MVEESLLGEKQVTPLALRRSVIDSPPPPGGGIPTTTSPMEALFYMVAQAADEMEPWGRNVKLRDRQLRVFTPTESTFASALGTVCARNCGFSWTVEGPPRVAARMQEILHNANLGEGWEDLINKLSFDLYTQDSGAFVEWVREGDSPESPLIGVNHLDASRCYPTGNPETPVVYLDRQNRYHELKWYQISTLTEMPAPIETRPGLQLCSLSRMLGAAQIIKNVSIYQYEKTGGRFHRAVHLVKGITAQQVQDAIKAAQEIASSKGLLRYLQPLIIGSIDPKADVGHDTLELASLPAGWDEEKMFKLYVAVIAMAFNTDYQEFAPLPGGNLGSSAQSQILHLKTKGKGPALFMKMVSHMFNFKGLPKTVEFKFLEQDQEAEKTEAEIKKLRADERSARLQSGEISVGEARQMAVDAGDLAEELFEAAGGLDVTKKVTIPDEEKPPETGGGQPAETLEEGEKSVKPWWIGRITV